MSRWKEGMTAQKSQKTEPAGIHGRCDTEGCSREEQITQMCLATLISKPYISVKETQE